MWPCGREPRPTGQGAGHDLVDVRVGVVALVDGGRRLGDGGDRPTPRPADRGAGPASPTQRASTTNVPSESVVAASMARVGPSAATAARRCGRRWALGLLGDPALSSGRDAAQRVERGEMRRGVARPRSLAVRVPAGRTGSEAARAYLSRSGPVSTACAAASRATGTRNGEHET